METHTTELPAGVRAEELDVVSVDIRTAARALKISSAYAYKLANRDEFPCRILRVGSRWTVPTGGPDGLKAVLGL